MDKGYDSTSISVLQRELNMSRGAMYRYFANKEELFICVIDEYFFKIMNKLVSRPLDVTSVKDTIEVVHRRQKIVVTSFVKAGFSETTFLNYTALIIQAAKHYPDFIKRFKEMHRTVKNSWIKVLLNAVNTGEIRKDVDVNIMSHLFCVASTEQSPDECNKNSFATNILVQINSKKAIMDYLYSLIKA